MNDTCTSFLVLKNGESKQKCAGHVYADNPDSLAAQLFISGSSLQECVPRF